MFNKSGFNAENLIEKMNRLSGIYKSSLLLRAFAEEGAGDNGEGGSSVTPPQINFEELIANARKEEKEKLYPRIKKLEDDNKTLVQTNNSNLMKLAEVQRELDELKANNGESKKVAELTAQIATLEAEKKALEESTPKEDEIRAKIEAEYEVKYYRTAKLTEGKDKILPVFADSVTGNTKEEIDASFDAAVQKTLDTKKQLGLVDDEGNPIVPGKKTTKKKETANPTTPTVPPVANPSDEQEETFDFDYVQSLDPRSKEYADFRKKMGLK